MPEFSACYFCGTALDAPLSEYPVVPEALHPPADQQRTVVLCPTCRRKLGAVVETILEAVEDAPDDASIQASLDEGASADGTPVEPDDGVEFEPESADVETAANDVDATTANDDRTDEETAEAEPAVETAADDGAVTDEEPAADDGAVTDEEPAADDGAVTDEEPAADDRVTTDEEADAEDEAAAPDATSDVGEEVGSSAASGESSEADAGSSPADDGSSTADAESSEANADSVEDEPQLTALEYNRVMRLLQNREFPVDHEEFKIVATNAYEIGDDEFDAIIEAAAERDLIGLEGGRIVES